MRYENEPCCGCGEVLCPATDDVVVCPDCGSPMHRHCWQAASGCPKSAQHGEGFAWCPTIIPEEPSFDQKNELGQICTECGDNCAPGDRFCDNCGANFEESSQSIFERAQQESLRREAQLRENFPRYMVNGRQLRMGDTVAGQPMEEISLQLRGSHRTVSRYLSRFENSGRFGWNWAAFLLGPYWFFFRKLYKPALIFAGVALALTFAFMPISSDINDRVFDGRITDSSYGELFQAVAQGAYAAEMQQAMQQYRWHLFALGALWLGARVVAGLVADDILRRKIFDNIGKLREGEILFGSGNPEATAVESAARRLGRHQTLMRMGGFSFFAPLAYFWALQLLPDMILEFIRFLTG